MTATICLLIAAAIGGVEAGWQNLDTGGSEYILLIEPDSVEELKTKGITHEISPQAVDIRRIVVFIGEGTLPRDAPQDATKAPKPIRDPAKAIRLSAESVKELETIGIQYELQQADRKAGRIEVFVGPPPRSSPNAAESAVKSDESSQQRPAGASTTENQGPSFGEFGTHDRYEVPVAPLPDETGSQAKANEKSTSAPRIPDWGIVNKGNAAPTIEKPAPGKENTASASAKPAPFNAKSTSFEKTNASQEPSPSDVMPKENNPPQPEKTAPVASRANEEPARPWLPLTVSLLALFASLGGNVYLGWLHVESRAKYRRLLERLQHETTSA